MTRQNQWVRTQLPKSAFGCLLALLVVSAGCSSSGGDAGQPTPTVSSPPGGPALGERTFLGVRLLVPKGWVAAREPSSAGDGQVTFTAPDRRGRIYLEVNSCVACVDAGDVARAVRNYVPAPEAVIHQYDPVTQHRRNVATIAYTTKVPNGYVSPSVLTVRKANGQILGYVVVEATFPAQYAATAHRVADSLEGKGIR